MAFRIGEGAMEHPEQLIAWGGPVLPVRSDAGVLASAKQRLGMAPGLLRAVADNPWVSALVVRLSQHPHAYASWDLLEQAMLVATQENACRYCYGAQRAFMRFSGYDDATITRLAEERELGELSPERRLALAFARGLARCNPRPGQHELRCLFDAGFAREVVAEVAFYVACFNNRLGTFLAVPQDADLERLPDSLMGWLFRGWLRRHARGRLTSPVSDVPAHGPFADITAALGHSPTAVVFSEGLDAAWASPILSSRAKALMFAVVAHGLDCSHCEARARELLLEHGLTATQIDEILLHLDSPLLTSEEARLVPYARESIRYRTVAIQQTTRALTDALGSERTLEAVATAALANAVVRLEMLLSC